MEMLGVEKLMIITGKVIAEESGEEIYIHFE
jgi:hypothetical protein